MKTFGQFLAESADTDLDDVASLAHQNERESLPRSMPEHEKDTHAAHGAFRNAHLYANDHGVDGNTFEAHLKRKGWAPGADETTHPFHQHALAAGFTHSGTSSNGNLHSHQYKHSDVSIPRSHSLILKSDDHSSPKGWSLTNGRTGRTTSDASRESDSARKLKSALKKLA
jgi:hypothetical protein